MVKDWRRALEREHAHVERKLAKERQEQARRRQVVDPRGREYRIVAVPAWDWLNLPDDGGLGSVVVSALALTLSGLRRLAPGADGWTVGVLTSSAWRGERVVARLRTASEASALAEVERLAAEIATGRLDRHRDEGAASPKRGK